MSQCPHCHHDVVPCIVQEVITQNNYEATLTTVVSRKSDLVRQFDDILEDIKGIVCSFNRDMLEILTNEYENFFDRNYVIEEIEINEYEFYSDGTIYCDWQPEKETA